jgi:hypothetical protein
MRTRIRQAILDRIRNSEQNASGLLSVMNLFSSQRVSSFTDILMLGHRKEIQSVHGIFPFHRSLLATIRAIFSDFVWLAYGE